jgi:hypothetical protein
MCCSWSTTNLKTWDGLVFTRQWLLWVVSNEIKVVVVVAVVAVAVVVVVVMAAAAAVVVWSAAVVVVVVWWGGRSPHTTTSACALCPDRVADMPQPACLSDLSVRLPDPAYI